MGPGREAHGQRGGEGGLSTGGAGLRPWDGRHTFLDLLCSSSTCGERGRKELWFGGEDGAGGDGGQCQAEAGSAPHRAWATRLGSFWAGLLPDPHTAMWAHVPRGTEVTAHTWFVSLVG